MGPDLWELFEDGSQDDEIAAIIRLGRVAVVPQGVRVVTQFGEIITVRMKRGAIPNVSGAAEVVSMIAGDSYLGPDLELESAGLPEFSSDTALHTDERRSKEQSATGLGVVIGIVDWGFDFCHNDFRNADGTTRILALWDQRGGKQPNSPQPFGYGRVYDRQAINTALKANDPYATLGYHPADADTGIGAHGTHVASIAAGSGGHGRPAGVAPEVDLILVHNAPWNDDTAGKLGDSVTLLEGIDFIARTAGDRPWVVNLSMGRHGEQHDGSTLVEQGLDAAIRGSPGRAICMSAGNYFDKRIHASGHLRPTQQRTFVWQINEGDPTYNELEIWYSWQDKFEVEVRSPDHSLQAHVKVGERAMFMVGGKEVGNVYHRAQEPNNLDNNIHIFLYREAPPGAWEVTVVGSDVIDGRFHAWIERDVACPRCQSHFRAEDADSRSTTGTICNGRRTIAVGAFNAHDPAQRIGRFSSVGPTRDGRLKPDLCAPGVSVLAARSAPKKAHDDAPLLTRMSGTSMAAPHVTGAVALMYQVAPRRLRIEETRNLLLESARRVSISDESPDRIGSGFLDVDEAVEAARHLGSVVPKLTHVSAQQPGAPHKESEGGSMESAEPEWGEGKADMEGEEAEGDQQNTFHRIAGDITGVFEGGKPGTLNLYDRGIISYGKHQATLASGTLYPILKRYSELSSSPTAASMARFLDRVQRRDESLREDQEFIRLLRAAANEPEMNRAQDEEFARQYWAPAKRTAASFNIKSALGHAILYDTRIQGGMDQVLKRTQVKLGGKVGDPVDGTEITEQRFLRVFMDERIQRKLRVAAHQKKQAEELNNEAQALENAASAEPARADELRRQAGEKRKKAKQNAANAAALEISATRTRGPSFLALVDEGDLNLYGGADGKVRLKGKSGVAIAGLKPGAIIDTSTYAESEWSADAAVAGQWLDGLAAGAALNEHTSEAVFGKGGDEGGETFFELEEIEKKEPSISPRPTAQAVKKLVSSAACQNLLASKSVAVVGGGFAGLMAARVLGQHGLKVTVFEPRSEVGGRVKSNDTFSNGRITEEGAELIGSFHTTWLDLAREPAYGLAMISRMDTELYGREGLNVRLKLDKPLSMAEINKLEEEMEKRVLEPIAQLAASKVRNESEPWLDPALQQYDNMSVAEALINLYKVKRSEPLWKMIEHKFVNDEVAALDDMNFLGLLCKVKAGQGRRFNGTDNDDKPNQMGYWKELEIFRCADGCQKLATGMVGEITTRNQPKGKMINMAVTNITLAKDRVLVGSKKVIDQKTGKLADDPPIFLPFDYVIFAIPPSVWDDVTITAGGTRLRPKKMGMDPAVKYFRNVKDRFWIEEKAAPYGGSLKIGQVWEGTDNQTRVGLQGIVLSVFAGPIVPVSGPGGTTFRAPTPSEFEAGLTDLYRGYASSRIKDPLFADWPNRPFIMTGYASPRKGEIFSVGPELNKPFQDRMFFAGEHTRMDFFGYMEGALRSGEDAARLLLAQACGGLKTPAASSKETELEHNNCHCAAAGDITAGVETGERGTLNPYDRGIIGARAGGLVELAEQTVGGQVRGDDPILEGMLAGVESAKYGGPLTAAELFDSFASPDPGALRRKLDQHFEVVALPREVLTQGLQEGDVLFRRGEGAAAHLSVIAGPELWTWQELLEQGLVPESYAGGQFAHVVDTGSRAHTRADWFAREVTDATGRLPSDSLVLRRRAPSEARSAEWLGWPGKQEPSRPAPAVGAPPIYDELTEFVRPVSMALTADAGKTLERAMPGGEFTATLADPTGWTGTVAVGGDGPVASNINFPVEMMHGGHAQVMPLLVFESLAWQRLALADAAFSRTVEIALPLTNRYLVASAQASRRRVTIRAGVSTTFPLESEIQIYATIVFAYRVDGQSGVVEPLDITNVPRGQLRRFLSNHGSLASGGAPKAAVLAVYDLALASPKDDFQPKGPSPVGPAEVARTYPLLSIWSSRPLASLKGTLEIVRPARTPMEGMHDRGVITNALYTDMNARIQPMWDCLHRAFRVALAGGAVPPMFPIPVGPVVIAGLHAVPCTRWDSIFAHYRLDARLSDITVVSPSAGRRTNGTARKVWDQSSRRYAPGSVPVVKVERQGTFDNAHMAPAMPYQGAAAFMAPICQHDCLHIHWRWSEMYHDLPLRGWSGGRPYQTPGAPMIPENQTLKVSARGPALTYSPIAAAVPERSWQIFMHHGTGFVSRLTPVGAAAPLLELAQMTSRAPDFNAFYYHNRMWETGGANRAADLPRLKESDFGPLEVL